MYSRILVGAAVGVLLGFLSSQSVLAVVLAEDDFSGPGSGTGWAAGDDWEGLGDGVVSTLGGGGGNASFRDFAAPIDATNQVTYIRYDYQHTDGGNSWGGFAFFEGSAGAGDENLFAGGNTGGGAGSYAIEYKNPNTELGSGVPFDTEFHKIVVGIDTTGADTTYNLWVDNSNVNAPNAAATVTHDVPGGIDAPWASLRFASGDGITELGDNLIIATTTAEVGLVDVNPTLTIDRTTGAVSLSSPTPLNSVVGYSLTSVGGSFDQSGWTTIAGNYDAPPGDGSVDPDDEWTVLSDPASTTDLSEFTFDVTPGDGGTIGATPVDLGTPWIRTPTEDVVARLTIDDGGEPLLVGASVIYAGAIVDGDLDNDGDVDANDWNRFKSGQGVVDNTMTLVAAYQLGDMDGNLDHNLTDFQLFEVAYNDFNGAGALSALISHVPEPSSLLLLAGGLAGYLFSRRRPQACVVCGLVIAALVATPRSVDATIFAQDDFSAADSGTGWAASDAWENLDVANGVADTAIVNQAFRAFATPLTPFNEQTIYVAFDMQASQGGQWGGVSFFEEAAGGAETLFVGEPAGDPVLGADLKEGTILDSGAPFNTSTNRIVLGINFNDPAGMDTYHIWVNNFDINNPNATQAIDFTTSPIQNDWASVRIGADGAEPITVDNLIIANQDEASAIFALPEVLEAVIDKSTGNISLENNSGGDLPINAYSLSSATNSLNVGNPDGDYNNDGRVNAADYVAWRNNLGAAAGTLPNDPNGGEIGTAQYDTWTANFGQSGGAGGWDSLADQDLAGFPSGSGSGDGWEEGANPSASELEEYYLIGESNFVNGTSISLGSAYGGGTAGEEDIIFQYKSGGELKGGLVSYTGGASAASQAVPEPSTLVYCLFGLLLAVRVYRSRN